MSTTQISRSAAVLWTGGKDSALAHYEAVQKGYNVTHLVTFAPENPDFRAHPISVMHAQAETLGLIHLVIEINEPFAESYKAAICSLRDDTQIGSLITGDIDLVDGKPNWIRECAAGTGVDVLTPLWNYDRENLLRRLIAQNFSVILSCVKRPWLGPEWLGREITWETLAELRSLNVSTNLDLCGENGEFHTLTLNGPLFRHPIHLDYTPMHTAEMSWMQVNGVK